VMRIVSPILMQGQSLHSFGKFSIEGVERCIEVVGKKVSNSGNSLHGYARCLVKGA
jgi:hypothetical protein